MYKCPNCGHEYMKFSGGGPENEPFEYWCSKCHLHIWPGGDARDTDVIYGSFSLYLADYGGVWVPAWMPVQGAPDDPEQPGVFDYWPAGWFGWGYKLQRLEELHNAGS